jgi:DNA-binding MarR family transcriptional regulator
MILLRTFCYARSMTSRAPATDLLFLLNQASHVLNTEMAARLADVGISPRAYCVLSNAKEGGRTQVELAERSGTDKTTMVVTLDELEKAGLAERQLSSTDRRARIIAVTKAGRQAVADADAVVAELYEDVLGALPARERKAFVDGLVQLVSDRLATPLHYARAPRRRRAS